MPPPPATTKVPPVTNALRLLNRTACGAATLALFSVGGLVLANPAAGSSPMTATTAVNLRSGPGTANPVRSVLAANEAVTATGATSGGWYEVTTKAGVTGWVSQNFLRAASASPETSSAVTLAATSASATGEATTTAAVNVRSGPGTGHGVIGVAPRGTTLGTTGTTSGGWTQVVWQGSAAWISTNYLSASPVTSTPAAGQVRTTANLYLRSAGNASASWDTVLPKGSVVDTTGATTATYTEVIVGGQNRWIATRYTVAVTAAAPVAPAPPAATGTVYVTVNSLNVRATSAADGAVVGTVTRGTALPTTGNTDNNRTEIIHQGVARWVYSPYVSATAPNASGGGGGASGVAITGYDKLTPSAKRIVDHVVANHPQIRSIGGWRASSSYSGDHPNGRAVDLMIPNWQSSANAEMGWELARFFADNAATFNVSYIIYRQQSWNASYPARGWRGMEDRGSATANHFDHVHISVRS